jgi:hypothetical protein
MTWTEMKQTFVSEWLLITDFDLDKSGHLIAGVVGKHSKDKEEVYQLPAVNQPTAFRYTGASTFAGWREHARKSDLL